MARIQRNSAVERIKVIIAGDSGAGQREPPVGDVDAVEEVDDELPDLERYARDLISKRISQRFKTHKFERLIDELLQAQGYVTERTTAGADARLTSWRGVGRWDVTSRASRCR